MDVEAEKAAIREEIHDAFRGVSRAGGISWRQTQIADKYGDEGFASYVDDDICWQDLATDPKWEVFPGIGGFAFLDPIGFRYYLPAAMIKALDYGDPEIEYSLSFDRETEEYQRGQWSLLDDRQKRCVAKFVDFMHRLHCLDSDLGRHDFKGPQRYWSQFLSC